MYKDFDKITSLLACTNAELESIIMQQYFDWCSEKSYVPAPSTPGTTNVLDLQLNMQDLQSLMADRALFNYFINIYLQSMLDFLEDVDGMNPMPNTTEARFMYKNATDKVHRFYNTDLMTAARNKKIQAHVKN